MIKICILMIRDNLAKSSILFQTVVHVHENMVWQLSWFWLKGVSFPKFSHTPNHHFFQTYLYLSATSKVANVQIKYTFNRSRSPIGMNFTLIQRSFQLNNDYQRYRRLIMHTICAWATLHLHDRYVILHTLYMCMHFRSGTGSKS